MFFWHGVQLRQGTKFGTSMLPSQEVYKFTMILVNHVVVMHVSHKLETWFALLEYVFLSCPPCIGNIKYAILVQFLCRTT
jgi:hypothetical protein